MKTYAIIGLIACLIGISGTWYIKGMQITNLKQQQQIQLEQVKRDFDNELNRINIESNKIEEAQRETINSLNNKLTTINDYLTAEGLGDYENIINNGNSIIDELVNKRMSKYNKTARSSNNTKQTSESSNSAIAESYKTGNKTKLSVENERSYTREQITFLMNFATDAEITNSALKQCVQHYDTVRTEVNNGQTSSEVK